MMKEDLCLLGSGQIPPPSPQILDFSILMFINIARRIGCSNALRLHDEGGAIAYLMAICVVFIYPIIFPSLFLFVLLYS